MEEKYLDDNLINPSFEHIASKIEFIEIKILPKKRGGLNEITQLREQTANLLKVPIGQVYGLTKGWSKNELRDILKTCNNFINPAALWWKIYNENKDTIKQRNKKVLLKNGEKRRKHNKREDGQKALF